MEKILLIIRGLPGAGKSTLAEALNIRAVCTADDWYVRNGIYKWNYMTIGEAHDWCKRKCRRFMQVGVERIIIANTSITARAIEPYFDMAKEFDYKVFSIILENRLSMKNIHNVPEETLENMKNKFEILL